MLNYSHGTPIPFDKKQLDYAKEQIIKTRLKEAGKRLKEG
jgi:hypothetical protein